MSPARLPDTPFTSLRHTGIPARTNDEYLNEADLFHNYVDSVRPPDTILYARSRPAVRNWFDHSRMRPAAPASINNYHYRNGRSAAMQTLSPNAATNLPPLATNGVADDAADIENHQSWEHYHRYKERRDLFSQLQAITSL